MLLSLPLLQWRVKCSDSVFFFLRFLLRLLLFAVTTITVATIFRPSHWCHAIKFMEWIFLFLHNENAAVLTHGNLMILAKRYIKLNAKQKKYTLCSYQPRWKEMIIEATGWRSFHAMQTEVDEMKSSGSYHNSTVII